MLKEILKRIGITNKDQMPNRMTRGFGAALDLTNVEEAKVRLEIAKKSEALSKKVMGGNRTGKYV